MDLKNSRLANTSPAVHKSRTLESNKNLFSKNAFKRNLFGEQIDQSPTILAKQLIESPLKLQTKQIGKENQSTKTPSSVHKEKNGNKNTFFKFCIR